MINFITGTGRCGSTILSKMLMLHPNALVLREFLAMLDFRMLTHEKVSGNGLAAILKADLHPIILLLQRIDLEEILYKLTTAEKRQAYWSRAGITMAALPYISDEPDKLFEELVNWAKQQPTDFLREHYPKMFQFIGDKTGRSVPIEASNAGNIDFHVFPNSRILHIHRSGPEVVLSMCQHPWFRMVASISIDPLTDEEFTTAVECAAPEEADPILKRMQKEDKELYPALIKIYTSLIAKNYRLFTQVKPENFMEIAFEDFAENPKDHLKKIAHFFELPDKGDSWLEEAAQMFKPVKLRLPNVDEKTQRFLKNACFAGQVLTGRQGRKRKNANQPGGLVKRMFKAHNREPESLI